MYALLMGTNLAGCDYSPIETRGEQQEVIRVPTECKDVLALVHNRRDNNWSLTCKSVEGKELFYDRGSVDKYWRKYKIVRE